MKVEITSFDRNTGEARLQEIDISNLYSVKFITAAGKLFDISFVDEGNSIRIREASGFSSGVTVLPEANNSIIVK